MPCRAKQQRLKPKQRRKGTRMGTIDIPMQQGALGLNCNGN